jgi:hypothetical protein
MKPSYYGMAAAVALGCAVAPSAQATTQTVTFNTLVGSASANLPFAVGDTLVVDSMVSGATGALNQSVSFTLGEGVASLTGSATWEISTATGPGPRLIGLNIDIFDASSVLVASDSFLGTLGSFAVSSLASNIGPGSYKLVATGSAVRDTVMDISLSFVGAVPEPQTYALLLTGLAAIGIAARRKR